MPPAPSHWRQPEKPPQEPTPGLVAEGEEWGGGDHTSGSSRVRASSLHQIDLIPPGGESQAQNAGRALETT